MADKTGIQWTEATWNPLAAFDRETGKRGWFCTRVSDGCKNCYAAEINQRLGNGHDYQLRNLEKIRFELVNLDQPRRWKRPRMVFVNSMTDLFHEAVPDGFVALVFAAMAAARHHTFQVLTKRPERMAALLDSAEFRGLTEDHWFERFADSRGLAMGVDWPLPNVWLGTSVENQATADERIPLLLRTPAAVRFVSCEPLLGSVQLNRWFIEQHGDYVIVPHEGVGIDWVIVGGESGKGARPFDIGWAESLIEQCRSAGVACFVKQLGKWIVGNPEPYCVQRWLFPDGHVFIPPIIGPQRDQRPAGAIAFGITDSKGGNPAEWPEELRVREFPTSTVSV